MAQALTDSNFSELVEQAQMPVVVDFWATWCGPCRMISPIVDKMAEKYEGKVNVVKCNVDESTDIPMKFGIRNIPTLLFFKGGELVDRVVGAVSQAEIEKHIEKIL
ncbi:MAG: thioredoxin [Bacteroidales bacterium]|jgi:thioredoxin 1|nr:thioredoxin [Bacteroidales bacterium]MBR4351695.1 thioredoxin [Bacteroidales bacterium]